MPATESKAQDDTPTKNTHSVPANDKKIDTTTNNQAPYQRSSDDGIKTAATLPKLMIYLRQDKSERR
jgi:hypothetical protein